MWRQERGGILAFFAVGMTALLAIASLAVDVGQVLVAKQHLSHAADAAALAAVQVLPDDPTLSNSLALDYLNRNGVDLSKATVDVSFSVANDQVQVRITEPQPATFARVVGVSRFYPQANARASIYAVSGVTGAVPLGVEAGAYVLNQVVTLKQSRDNQRGNFHALDLSCPGASCYENDLTNGFPALLRIWNENDVLEDAPDTQPGNMAGPTYRGVKSRLDSDPGATYNNFKKGSRRLLYVPVVETFDLNGKKKAKIIGFAAFWLESVTRQGEVTGRFIQYLTRGEIGTAPDFGLRTIRLEA